MIDNLIQTLKKDIDEHLQIMISNGYSLSTCGAYKAELNSFLLFIIQHQISWDNIFTPDTFKDFQKNKPASHGTAVRALWRHLFDHKRIHQPVDPPGLRLPDIYENYLLYYNQTRQCSFINLSGLRSVLFAFHDCLEKQHIKPACLRIEQIDAFLAEFLIPFSPNTRQTYRNYIRGFLKYLHYQKITRKNLAPLVVGRRQFTQSTPPKFFRPHEIKQLFDSFELTSFTDIRNHAMARLAYGLGLRPDEIRHITLDDISFAKSELTLTRRKNGCPIKLPLPEAIVKAIASYVIGARPKSSHRELFLNLLAPYRPLCANSVGQHITACIHKAGLPGSAYWLRHTYAQNLLEAGSSIFEIKEMMGHNAINSAEKYLTIHITLMRKVLFNEEL
jgi:integrase/recombinase XerD